jgi:hypothetical protein
MHRIGQGTIARDHMSRHAGFPACIVHRDRIAETGSKTTPGLQLP